jgi:hypothetical protein
MNEMRLSKLFPKEKNIGTRERHYKLHMPLKRVSFHFSTGKSKPVDITSFWAKCYSLASPVDQHSDILFLLTVWEIPGKSQDFRVRTSSCVQLKANFPPS